MADEEKPKEQKPWEMSWLEKPKQAVVQAVDAVKDTVKGIKMPWEMDWQERPRGSTPEPQKAPVALSKGFDMDDYVERVIKAESSGNPEAKSKTSSAVGLAQFTRATWLEQVAKQGKPYTLNDRKDPAKAREILRGFTQENLERARQQLGREPTGAEMYMYHFAPGKAKRLIEADPNVPATTLVSKAIAAANKPVFFHQENGKFTRPRTIKELKALFERKIGENVRVQRESSSDWSKKVAAVEAGIKDRLGKARQNLLRKTAESEEYGELVGFLSDRRAVPETVVKYIDGNGMFITPLTKKAGIPDSGQIVVTSGLFDESKPDASAPGTLIHEMTHAADRQLRRLAYELKTSNRSLTPEEEQFMDTFNKTMKGRKEEDYQEFAEKIALAIDPEWKKKNRDYRSSYEELPAFAMGQSKKKGDKFMDAPPHIDPSIATQFRILLDQARKVTKNQRKSEGR